MWKYIRSLNTKVFMDIESLLKYNTLSSSNTLSGGGRMAQANTCAFDTVPIE